MRSCLLTNETCDPSRNGEQSGGVIGYIEFFRKKKETEEKATEEKEQQNPLSQYFSNTSLSSTTTSDIDRVRGVESIFL